MIQKISQELPVKMFANILDILLGTVLDSFLQDQVNDSSEERFSAVSAT